MEVSSRSTPAFNDNIDAVWKMLTTTSWLNDIISAKSDETNQIDSPEELDVNYELADTV